MGFQIDPKSVQKISKIDEIHKRALPTSTLKMRFLKNTHKPDIFTISKGMKRDDVSMPILKVSPGQDLETQLQKKVREIHQMRPRNGTCPY